MNLGYYIGFGVVFYLISAVALLQLVSIVMDFKGIGGMVSAPKVQAI